ncbi:MAG: hypothetical protein MSG64_07915 [Pyrinomonadaceae bacterium MAG19_C2-C3]|nr:hypothetical protein [Pyrinomonadaceae bacterium MAG19_C2-C3]
MFKKIIAHITLSLTFFNLAAFVPAQSPSPNKQPSQATATLRAVPVGGSLVVETRDGKSTKAKFQSITDSTLFVSRKSRTIEFNLTDVRRVFRVTGRSRTKTTLIGGAVGAAIPIGLVAIAGAADDTGGSDGEVAAIALGAGALGAAIGAGVGALVGRGRKRVLIYEAP